AADNGMRVCNVDPRKNRGTSRAFFRFLAQYYNLTSDDNLNWQETVQYLRQGRPVIVSGAGPQPFTRNGHFIVLVEYNDDGTITVNDPNKGATNGRPAVAKYPVGVIRDNFHFSTVFYR
ncbi:MAG TPA: C39 family peptidase, partial [Flavobacterium sp.]|nr:C39 family peptidase [Flavobacterium sp.]